MVSIPPNRLARSVWTLYMKAQRDTVLKVLASEADPERRRLLQAEADRYQIMLGMEAETKETNGASR